MKFILNPFRVIYCLYALLIFVVLMLLIFPFVLIATFWGKVKGGNFIYKLCRFWSDAWLLLVGVRHKNYFDETVSPDKQYIFIANHISYIDIPLILRAIRHNALRALGKFEMKRLPIFGFIYRHAAIMVDRSSPDNRSKSVRELKAVLNEGISIFVYPEGTFNETHHALKDFFDGAFRIAIETQTPIKPILFLDTYDRMNYISVFSLNPGKSRAIFMDDVDVSGLTIQDLQSLKEQVYNSMDAMLKKYNATWITE